MGGGLERRGNIRQDKMSKEDGICRKEMEARVMLRKQEERKETKEGVTSSSVIRLVLSLLLSPCLSSLLWLSMCEHLHSLYKYFEAGEEAQPLLLYAGVWGCCFALSEASRGRMM